MNLRSLALTGAANTAGKAPVISLISKIRIDDSLCIDSVTLLHHKTIKTIPFDRAYVKRKPNSQPNV